MKLLIKRNDDDVDVWVTLDGHDPLTDAFGFVVGTGATRDDAVADAVRELERALDELQSPVGVIEERAS